MGVVGIIGILVAARGVVAGARFNSSLVVISLLYKILFYFDA